MDYFNNYNFSKNNQNSDNNGAFSEKQIDRAKNKADRQRIRAQRKIELAKLKNRKQMEKARLKEERKNEKLQIKRQREKNGGRAFGGWLAAVISLGVVVIGLSSVLGYVMFSPSASDNTLENSYRKSYYEAASYVDAMDVNLSKVLATKDETALQKYLMTLAVNAELCEANLQQLPLQDESKYYTVKLVNQIGDYAKYLEEKLIDGKSLDIQDRNALQQLYEGNLELKNGLQKINAGLEEGYSFNDLVNEEQSDVVLSNFSELQNLSVEYPELIYDGPFSDGETYNEIKGTSAEEVSYEKAVSIFREAFADYNLQSVTYNGETDGDLKTYNFSAMAEHGEISAKIAKMGGNIILFSMNAATPEDRFNSEECIAKAKDFINSLGYGNMNDVWNTTANGTEVINFVYENEGVLFYPDMVKVNVNRYTGMVTGIEASKYYVNHVERSAEFAGITEETAKNAVSDEIDVLYSRKVVIPKGTRAEEAAYEFMGTYNDSTYYVFVSAITGRQINMFKVIDSTNGQLLI